MQGARPGWAGKALVVIIFTSIFFRCVCAYNHSVGGPSGWDLSSNVQLWSAATSFLVGDNLVFTYTPDHDVVEVSQLGYDTCVISSAIGTYDDGETVIQLTEPGIRYFVCGRSGHCQQGLKLQVQVLAQPNNGTNANRRRPTPRLPPRKPPPSPRRSPPPPLSLVPTSPSSLPFPPPADVPVPVSGVDNIKLDTLGLFQGLVPVIALAVLYSLTLMLV
ncbi:uclacyanin 1-like [Prosopis cineraria]|uniref:uclacyanin 1-like n=1 Tax=Prosopis cineraria TaxID=364024 RepID=UPI00240F3758|nr:uclacyanin 1-like [Prosopis cineraria]